MQYSDEALCDGLKLFAEMLPRHEVLAVHLVSHFDGRKVNKQHGFPVLGHLTGFFVCLRDQMSFGQDSLEPASVSTGLQRL